MRPLIILAVTLLFTSATRAAQADWRRDGVDDRVKTALTSLGWRLEDDGRALDPATKAPAAKSVLEKAVLDLRLGARRAALEAVNLMLIYDKPLEAEDRQKIKMLSIDLSPALATAALDPKSDLNKVRAMADADLSRVAAYFDGGRTMADRRAATQPVSAGTPGPRFDLPYYTAQEQSVGEKLQALARAEIGRDPFGKTVLSRLNVRGKPDLSPIVIEDLDGPVVAQYDFRRGVIALDRENVLASVIGIVPPHQMPALRASLSSRDALTAYLETHPEALTSVVKDNDAVLVHELTHAWQDRRDPIFREIARGNLPDVQPLEYEEEAYITKNLYIHSKIEHAPASVRMDDEYRNFFAMLHAPNAWRMSLVDALRKSSPSRAISLQNIMDIQTARLARIKARASHTTEDEQTKALDIAAMSLGRKEISKLAVAHQTRMAPINTKLDHAMTERPELLGGFYLIQAQQSIKLTDRIALLDQAERYAIASQNGTLLEEVRKAREKK